MKLVEIHKIDDLIPNRIYFTAFITHKYEPKTNNIEAVKVVSVLKNANGIKYIRSNSGSITFSKRRWFDGVPVDFGKFLNEMEKD